MTTAQEGGKVTRNVVTVVIQLGIKSLINASLIAAIGA
jgi:hypothetical protein